MAMNRRKGNRDKRTSPGEQTMTKGVFFFSENEMEIGFAVFIRPFSLLICCEIEISRTVRRINCLFQSILFVFASKTSDEVC